jgi:sigma-E factor negative regulatory protein RseA
VLAAAPAAAGVTAGAAAAPPVLEASALGSRIVRDAQLDRYLRAHRDYGTALPGSLPGGPARSIATVSLER